MVTFTRTLLLLLLCTACRGDETLAAYGAGDKTWKLIELDGAPFTARATLTFPEPGRITGQAPCNRFNSTQNAPYPWFEMGEAMTTRMACPEMAEETRFLSALSAMTQSEVLGNSLILRNETGGEMVFEAE